MKRFRKLVRHTDHAFQYYTTEDGDRVVFDETRKDEWSKLEVLYPNGTTSEVRVETRVTAWEIPDRKEHDWHTTICPIPVAVFNLRGVEIHAPLERFKGVAVEPFLAKKESNDE